MDTTALRRINLADLSPLERLKKVKVKVAAELNDVHVSTFKRNYPHLIRRVGKRTDVVTVEDALTLPPPSSALKAKRA